MALIEAAPPAELTGEFSHFRSTFKRHTPFAIDFVEQRLEGSTIEFVRGGDIILYTYLYSNVIDWRSAFTSMDLLIGEQVIDSQPIEYIMDYAPILLGHTQSVAEYQNATFLPLPIPRLPICALKYHTVKLRFNGIKTPFRCQACMAYLSDDERVQIKNFDMLINQVQVRPVCSDGTVYLSNPVKFLWSNTLSTNRLLINSADLWVNDPSVGLYYSTSYGTNAGFTNPSSYKYMDMYKFLGTAPWGIRTLQTVKGRTFLFSSQLNPARMAVFTMGPMNSPSSWNVISM
jgi:hypothetical protein